MELPRYYGFNSLYAPVPIRVRVWARVRAWAWARVRASVRARVRTRVMLTVRDGARVRVSFISDLHWGV
jgi:hypothetical protein